MPLWSDETLMCQRVKAKAMSLCLYDFKQWKQKRLISGLARGRPHILSIRPHPLFHRSGFAPLSYANSEANPGKEHYRVFGSYCTFHWGRSLMDFFFCRYMFTEILQINKNWRTNFLDNNKTTSHMYQKKLCDHHQKHYQTLKGPIRNIYRNLLAYNWLKYMYV